MSVVAYRNFNGDRLDVLRLGRMRLHGELLERPDHSGIREGTALGAWINRCKHRDHCSLAECKTSPPKRYMWYVRRVEEAVYERKLSEIILSLIVINGHPEKHEYGAHASPSILLVVLWWTLDHLWFCHAHEHLKKDVYFEIHRRAPPLIIWTFARWHIVEVFALLPADHGPLFVPEQPWGGEYEESWSYAFRVHPSLRLKND